MSSLIRFYKAECQVEIRQGNWGHSVSISKVEGGNFFTVGDICFHLIYTLTQTLPLKTSVQLSFGTLCLFIFLRAHKVLNDVNEHLLDGNYVLEACGGAQ